MINCEFKHTSLSAAFQHWHITATSRAIVAASTHLQRFYLLERTNSFKLFSRKPIFHEKVLILSSHDMSFQERNQPDFLRTNQVMTWCSLTSLTSCRPYSQGKKATFPGSRKWLPKILLGPIQREKLKTGHQQLQFYSQQRHQPVTTWSSKNNVHQKLENFPFFSPLFGCGTQILLDGSNVINFRPYCLLQPM